MYHNINFWLNLFYNNKKETWNNLGLTVFLIEEEQMSSQRTIKQYYFLKMGKTTGMSGKVK